MFQVGGGCAAVHINSGAQLAQLVQSVITIPSRTETVLMKLSTVGARICAIERRRDCSEGAIIIKERASILYYTHQRSFDQPLHF